MLRNLAIAAIVSIVAAQGYAAPTSVPDAPVNTWVLRNPDGPNITWENGIAYDPATHLVAWYGGHAWGYPQSNYTHLYDIATNTWRDSTAPYRPQRRCLVMLNYLDSAGCMISTQGSSGHGSIPEGGFGGDYKRVNKSDPRGPWLYDVTADRWTNCRTLPPIWKREAHCQCAYDPTTDALVWLTGEKLGLYCPRTNRVSYRDLPKELTGRLAYGIAADPVAGKIVLFGGTGPGGFIWAKGDLAEAYDKFVHNDTWLYDVAADKWQKYESKVNPPRGMPLFDHRFIPMVYHDPSGTIIMQQTPVDKYEPDTTKWPATQFWYLDLFLDHDGWKPLDLKDPPPFQGLLAYARAEDLLVLVGGGKDGEVVGEGGKKYFRPSLSKQLWTCKVDLPGARKRVARKPAVSVATSADGNALTVQITGNAPQGLTRAEVDAKTGLPSQWLPLDVEGLRGAEPGVFKFVDKAVKQGKAYAYAFEESVENGVEIFPPPAFSQPWHPTGLTASVQDAKRVVLRWNANKEADLVGYTVYRATGNDVEKANGTALNGKPTAETTFTDTTVDLSDGVARSYWVTAVNKGGVESGASPLAYSFPGPPLALKAAKGIAVRVDDPRTLVVTWDWPANVKIAGVNVYCVNNHLNTHGEPPEKVKAWYDSWKKVNDRPVEGGKFVFTIPADDVAKHHYFYVRAVNVLGQEGFYTDIVSATDRRFHP